MYMKQGLSSNLCFFGIEKAASLESARKAPSVCFTQIFIQFFIHILRYPKTQILKFGQNLVVLDIFI